jgi:hypothetical protein
VKAEEEEQERHHHVSHHSLKFRRNKNISVSEEHKKENSSQANQILQAKEHLSSSAIGVD